MWGGIGLEALVSCLKQKDGEIKPLVISKGNQVGQDHTGVLLGET